MEQPTETATTPLSYVIMEAPAPATPMYCTDQNPLTPSPFRGDLFQDVDDWAAEKTEEEEGNGATPDVYDPAVAALAKHFDTTCNLVVERHRFHHRIQFPGESIQEYVTALTKLAAMCSFTSQEE
ncbi:hypothetical protein HPB52_024826 [Rhipicephalus sanguineus]|uniref:Retrotransposon gag domain-containing protein n=1 Tax=Rhipicephalus sanguineus TaxID=34632 RepID=A0A9D4TDS6_RHISA|nr:hypothetical protein HPB52_024826 [Rhipicephalus sanguineus]